MPRIPSDSYFPTADVGAAQPFRVDTSALSPDLAAMPGRQEQQVGQGLMNLGGEATRIATDFQDQINQTLVIDAANNARQKKSVLRDDPKNGYMAKMGMDALEPEPGTNLPNLYLDEFQKYSDELMAGLKNDRQREMLKPHLADIALQIQQEAGGHATAQYKELRRSALDGQFKLAVDDAARNWQDPTATAKGLTQAMTAMALAGRDAGKASTEIEAQVRAASSTVHLKVIEGALAAGNPSYANLYFQTHKDATYKDPDKQVVPKDAPGAVMVDGGMQADDILHVQGTMTRHLDTAQSQQIVGMANDHFASRFVPTDKDRLTSIVSGIESGGRDLGADGTPVTSVKGAKYAMQVMPATAKNPGFGIRPAADDSPAEYNRVGREYLAALVEKYGNAAQALAAYNAGPGAVDAAIRDKGVAWLGTMPRETQDYVAKGKQQLDSGQGAPSAPTEQEYISYGLAQLGQNPRPELVQLTRAALEHQHGITVKSMKEQGDVAYNNLLRAVIAKGGDLNQVDAGLKMELARLDPDKYDNAIKMGKIVSDQAAGKNVETSPTAMVTSISHPERLAAMRDGEFTAWMTSNFPKSEWASVAKRRDDAINGSVDTSAGGVNHKALDRVITLNQVGMGLDPAKGGSDPKLRQAVDNQKAYITQTVLDQQAQLGRKMTEDEIIKHVNKVYATDVKFQQGMGFLGLSGGSQPLMKINTVADLPDGAADGIKKMLAEKGNKNPTESQVVQFYWKMHR